MKPTLDIDEDVLFAAKEIAKREHSAVGTVISRLARGALLAAGSGEVDGRQRKIRNGVPIFPARPGEVITVEHVQKLAAEEAT